MRRFWKIHRATGEIKPPKCENKKFKNHFITISAIMGNSEGSVHFCVGSIETQRWTATNVWVDDGLEESLPVTPMINHMSCDWRSWVQTCKVFSASQVSNVSSKSVWSCENVKSRASPSVWSQTQKNTKHYTHMRQPIALQCFLLRRHILRAKFCQAPTSPIPNANNKASTAIHVLSRSVNSFLNFQVWYRPVFSAIVNSKPPEMRPTGRAAKYIGAIVMARYMPSYIKQLFEGLAIFFSVETRHTLEVNMFGQRVQASAGPLWTQAPARPNEGK